MSADATFNSNSINPDQTQRSPAGLPAGSPRSILIDWANGQDGWTRAVASEVIESRKEIQDDKVLDFYHTMLREKGITAGDPVSIAALCGDPATADQGAALLLMEILGVENVNLLAPGQCVSFSPSLSVFFGENASGKSGYVRILKKVSNARAIENVLPNVTDPSTVSRKPKACIKYSDGGSPGQISWNDEAGLPPLNRIDVFDSRSTRLHLDEDLTYIYTPGELALYPLIQQSIEKVRRKLDADIKALKPTANLFQANFRSGTAVHTKIGSLTALTNLEDLHTLACLSDAEKAELENLKAEVDTLRSQTPQAQLRLAEQDQLLLQDVRSALLVLSGISLVAIQQSREQLEVATEKYKTSTETSFAGSDIPNVLKAEWKAFIEAGEAYLKTIDGHDRYPTAEDRCIYCRQILDAAATDLLKKFREYNNGLLRDEVNRIERTLKAQVDVVRSLPLSPLSARTKQQVDIVPPTANAPAFVRLLDFLTRAVILQQHVIEGLNYAWDDLSAHVRDCSDLASVQHGVVTALMANLKQEFAQRQIELSTREKKIGELNDRLKLREILPQVEDYILRLKWASSAESQSRGFQSILRSLTTASKSASEKLLNRGFESLFKEECKALRAPSVKLGFPGRQGQVTRKKVISAQHDLSEILSEGEQKVIALADFIAELRLKRLPSPTVFDDPITSLDYRRMKHVVERIVKLAAERQVIVFSHNIWFVTELLAAGEKLSQPTFYYDIQRSDASVGIVTRGTYPRSDTYKILKAKINMLIQKAGGLTGETQQALIDNTYDHMRSICEVIVESGLLKGVTQRYEANVRMNLLGQIKTDRLSEAIEAIVPIYDKCCRCIVSHSQPMETLNVRPTLAELQTDWHELQDARNKYEREN